MEKQHSCGSEEDFSVYKKKDTRPACDQLAHLLRSIFWQSNHLKHWKKEHVKLPLTERIKK